MAHRKWNRHFYWKEVTLLEQDWDDWNGIDISFQEEPYQSPQSGEHGKPAFRPSVQRLPAIGYTSPWPEQRQ